jgi:WD40 repeat protein
MFEERLLATVPEEFSDWCCPEFSGDGASVAYKVKQNGKEFVMIGAYKGPEFDSVSDILFAPDENQVVYRAKLGTREFIMVGDRKGPEFDKVVLTLSLHPPHPFSPDGMKLLYLANQGDKWFVVNNDQKGPEYTMVVDPIFAPDGTETYAAQEGDLGENDKWFIIVGRERVHAVNAIFVLRPSFSQDITRLAYIAQDDQGYLLVANDGPGVRYDLIGDLVFSPSGHVLAFRAKRGKKEFIVADGQEGPEFEVTSRIHFDAVGNPVFSPDGHKIAYSVRQQDGKSLVVFGDATQSDFTRSTFDSVSSIVFSPDGARVAYAAEDGRRNFIVIGEDKGEAFDTVGRPVFNPEGTKVGCGAQIGRQLWWKVRAIQ